MCMLAGMNRLVVIEENIAITSEMATITVIVAIWFEAAGMFQIEFASGADDQLPRRRPPRCVFVPGVGLAGCILSIMLSTSARR